MNKTMIRLVLGAGAGLLAGSALALTPKAAEDENAAVTSVAKPPPRIKAGANKTTSKHGQKHRSGKRKKSAAI